MITKEQIEKMLTEQECGDKTCPRCGRATMSENIYTNALSRHADVYVCDDCGVNEGMRVFTDTVLPFEEWAIIKNGTSV